MERGLPLEQRARDQNLHRREAHSLGGRYLSCADSDISGIFAPPPEPAGVHPSGMQKTSLDGKPFSCVEMRFEIPLGAAGFSNTERTECFDDATGLLGQVQLQANKPNMWDFSDYQPWGNGKFVATTLKHQASSGEYFEVHVSKLTAETFEPSQFAVTEEGLPAKCKMQPPRPLRTPEPEPFAASTSGSPNIRAVYKIKLGSDGIPIEVSPEISGGGQYDQESVSGIDDLEVCACEVRRKTSACQYRCGSEPHSC